MGWLSMLIQSLLLPADATPLDLSVILMLFSVMTVQSMNQTIVLPYLPQMMKDFGTKETDVGFFAGLVAGSMYLGMMIAALVWGWLSDVRGKRTMLILSTTLNALATILFGFSTSIPYAIIARLLLGLTNGIIVVVKAMIVAICDDSNQSAGMAIVLSSDTFGMITGPIIGGYLSLPAERYPAVFSKSSVFCRFPFLLPNLTIFILLCLLILWEWHSLCGIEILGRLTRTFHSESCVECGRSISLDDSGVKHSFVEKQEEVQPLLYPESFPVVHDCCDVPDKHLRTKKEVTTVDTLPFDFISPSMFVSFEELSSSRFEVSLQSSVNCLEKTDSRTRTNCSHSLTRESKPSWMWLVFIWCREKKWKKMLMYKLFSVSDVRWSCGLYALLTLSTLGFADVLPLWTSTSPSYAGLGFSTAKIGLLLLIVAIPSLLLPAIAPRVMSLCSVRKIYAWTSLCTMFAICLLPNLAQIRNSVIFMLVASVLLILVQYGVNVLFIAVNIIVNHSTPHSSFVGSVNGMAFSAMNLARSIAPVFLGSVYSWSLNNEQVIFEQGLGYPLNKYLAFYVIGLLLFVGAYISTCFSESINATKRDCDCEIEF